MGLIRPSVLLLAIAMSAPAIYRLMMGELDITGALTRYLIAVPVAAVMLAGLRVMTSNYGRTETPMQLRGSEPVAEGEADQPAPAT